MQPQLKSGEIKKSKRWKPARARQIRKRKAIRRAGMVRKEKE